MRSVLAFSVLTLSARATGAQTSAPPSAPAAPAAPSASTAPADTSNYPLVRQFLEASQAATVAYRAVEASLPGQRAANPQIPEAFWTEFLAEVKAGMPQLVERLVPIYASRFSPDELTQLIAFYQSPVGKHLAEEQASIGLESMRAGQLWGAEIGAQVVKHLTEQGVVLH